MRTFGLAVLMLLLAAPPAATDENIPIETLPDAGWEIAGYAAVNQSTVESESALILLRNAHEKFLVQCRANYDVTRNPSVFSHCYKLR